MLRWPTRDLRSSQAQARPDSILDPIAPAPSADDVIAGYKQLIARAHLHKMRIIGATLTPFEDTFKCSPLEGYYNADKEKKHPFGGFQTASPTPAVRSNTPP